MQLKLSTLLIIIAVLFVVYVCTDKSKTAGGGMPMGPGPAMPPMSEAEMHGGPGPVMPLPPMYPGDVMPMGPGPVMDGGVTMIEGFDTTEPVTYI